MPEYFCSKSEYRFQAVVKQIVIRNIISSILLDDIFKDFTFLKLHIIFIIKIESTSIYFISQELNIDYKNYFVIFKKNLFIP